MEKPKNAGSASVLHTEMDKKHRSAEERESGDKRGITMSSGRKRMV